MLAILKADVENFSHSGVPQNKAANTTNIATFTRCLILARDVGRITFPLSGGPKEVSVGAEEMLS